MAFIPQPGQIIWYDRRAETASEVLAVDTASTSMWIRPLGSTPRSQTYSDHWSSVPPHPAFPDLWCVVTATDVSKGFASRSAVIAGAPAGSLALLHVNPDNTVDVEYPFL